MKRFKTVDDYIDKNELWPDELRRIREILLTTVLTKEVKWGAPCYTHDPAITRRYVKEAMQLQDHLHNRSVR